jgi:thioredoxin 1
VEEIAGEFAGKAKFVKVDVEDSEDIAVKYGIFAVPTLLFFKQGQPVDKVQGLIAKPVLKQRVESLLSA